MSWLLNSFSDIAYYGLLKVLFETIDMLKRTLDHDPENMGKLANVYVSVSGIVGKDASRLDEALELGECWYSNQKYEN